MDEKQIALERANLDAWLRRVEGKKAQWETRIKAMEKAVKKPSKKSK